LQRLTDAVQAEYLLKPADTARLWRVAGIAAGIRGWLENNAGDTKAARASLREAHRRGELIDDNQLIAWARYMQAIIEDYAGDPVAAERYALDGLRRTSKHSPQRGLILVGVIAKICATRHDQDGTEKALVRAHEIVTALPPERHGPAHRMIADDMNTYSPAQFAAGAGSAYARLGRLDCFAEVTAEARQAADRSGTNLRVYFRTDEALGVLRSANPDPERAAGLAREGLSLASPFQTGHVIDRLEAILNASKPFKTDPAIVDLAEYGAVWRAERLAHPAADA
jgi:hypothetical protein